MKEGELQDFPLLFYTDHTQGTGILTLVLSLGSLSALEALPKGSCACVPIPMDNNCSQTILSVFYEG